MLRRWSSPIIILSVMALALNTLLTLAAPLQPVSTSWLNLMWQYRRAVSVNNPNGSGPTGFQVLITLDNTFDYSKAKSDGSDVRITGQDGVTQLPLWIESWNPGAQAARLWVKVPSLPASGTQRLYLYYGNAAASSASNGGNTFEFFDDFETPSGQFGDGYYNLSAGQTVMVQSGWEAHAPHTLSVVPAPSGSGYQYFGYYSLSACPTQIGLARSNDLVNWVKDTNPIISGVGERWPSVLHEGSTFYMVHTSNYCDTSYIVLQTSTDGVNFGPPLTLVAQEVGNYNQNPNLFHDPNPPNHYYLYWANSRGIKVRSAATVEGLASTTSEQLLFEQYNLLAAPNMLFYNDTYFLSVETSDFGTVNWSTWIYSSPSPLGPFKVLPDNPMMAGGSACTFQHVFGTMLHDYYCKLTDTTWTLDHRSADLTAGRRQVQLLDPGKWTPSGTYAAWTVTTTTQQDGSTGTVAQGAVLARQTAYSSFSGSDYVVEAYGKQVSGRNWGLVARSANGFPYYSAILFSNQDNTQNLYLNKNGGEILTNTTVGPIDLNTWYRMKIKVHGSSLEVYLNDVLRLQYTDAQAIPAGSIALWGEEATVAQFNNVLVRKYADLEPLTSVGFEETSTTTLIWLPLIERNTH